MAVNIDTKYPSAKNVEAAWSEEIKRRLAEIDSGAVELVPWEEVRAELFGQASPTFPNPARTD
jgi:putative addiction module component (TIGR02574 family)